MQTSTPPLLAYAATALSLTLALGTFVWFLLDRRSAPSRILMPESPTVVMQGEQIYTKYCAACHGDKLQGQPDWKKRKANGSLPAPPHDASGHTWHHTDQMLFDLTKKGIQNIAGSGYITDMPVYEGVLNDNEIIAVLSYIKSRWPAEIRVRHDELNREKAQRD